MSQQPPPPPQVGQVVNGHQWNGQQWVPLPPQVAQQPPFQPTPTPTKPKKPLLKRWWVWAIAVVVLLMVFSTLGRGSSSSTPTAGETAPPSTEVTAAAEPSEVVSTDQDATAGDTTTTEPSADDAARAAISDAYGSFGTITKTGRGPNVIKLPAGVAAGMVTATHAGSSNFVISALDSSNQSTGDLLVNEIGKYSGTTAFGLSSLGDAVKLKIDADGAWKVKIAPLYKAPVLSLPAAASGDKVFIWAGDAADWSITHKGRSNFVVIQYTDVFPNLMVNEIGRYKGTVPANEGPNIVVLQADGSWTIKQA